MERPILFSAPMVRAILDGRKTQTRRVLPEQPEMAANGDCRIRGTFGPVNYLMRGVYARFWTKYRVGDLLWVRERFLPDAPAADEGWDDEGLSFVEWDGCGRRLDGIPKIYRSPKHCIYYADEKWASYSDWKWRPSIHMPRWASRITLLVTAVKVERLQDISEADAVAEGICQAGDGFSASPGYHPLWGATAQGAFYCLWRSINGPGSWDANPWVAAYTFERVKP